MNSIHISTARLILNRPEPVDIRLWTSKGEIQEWKRCICIKYDHYKGTRKFKLLNSNEIRQTRECQIFMLNGMTVFMWKQHIFPVIAEYFRIISYLCTRKVVAQWCCLSYCSCFTCIRSTLIGKTKRRASVLCTWIRKIQYCIQDGVRRFTYIRGLVVSWSVCRVFPEPRCRDVGTMAHVSCLYQAAWRKSIEIIA